ncbi:TPA: hypothetical protein I9003_001364 [Clostridium perfringens]|nr:hypothetical protein [Clostridium perfringens]
MQIKLIKQEDMERLIANVEANIQNGNYYKEEPWLNEWLGDSSLIETGIYIKDIELVNPKEKSTDTDFENAKILYEALKDNISIDLATDNRFWCYLTHGVFWRYMTKRWSLEGLDEKKAKSRILDRYLMKNSGDKALLRNQLSKLWWIVYTTYDETLLDPYEYTRFFLGKSDLQVGLMERTFSRNPNLTKGVIRAIKKYSDEFRSPNRDELRALLKELNGLGGVKVLDLLDAEYIYNFTKDILSELNKK